MVVLWREKRIEWEPLFLLRLDSGYVYGSETDKEKKRTNFAIVLSDLGIQTIAKLGDASGSEN